MEYILVTGSNGMIGKKTVTTLLNKGYHVLGISNEEKSDIFSERYKYINLNVIDYLAMKNLFNEYDISRVIHLAAIAHTSKEMDSSWSQYYRINTLASKNLFSLAEEKRLPVFFASSLDVYGITNGSVNTRTHTKPIGNYAKSKSIAEDYLKEICSKYTIARLAPVYTEENQKDIRKRYFISYPNICYCIGKGLDYEFVNINKVVNSIAEWCDNKKVENQIINLYDNEVINTKKLIKKEQSIGNGKICIIVPLWLAKVMETGVNICFRRNEYFRFKVSKVLNPIKIERD